VHRGRLLHPKGLAHQEQRPTLGLEISWAPPRKRIAMIRAVHPATQRWVKSRMIRAYPIATTASPAERKPISVDSRRGLIEKDRMPSSANRTILLSGYLVSPANRAARR
jgi:hypothetical protein